MELHIVSKRWFFTYKIILPASNSCLSFSSNKFSLAEVIKASARGALLPSFGDDTCEEEGEAAGDPCAEVAGEAAGDPSAELGLDNPFNLCNALK